MSSIPLPILTGFVGLIVYAFLLGLGGVIGFKKAGSRPSLIAGSVSAFVAIVSAGLVGLGGLGFWLGLLLTLAMIVVFGIRYYKTRKFMPSGLLLGSSLVMCGLMVWALWFLFTVP